MMMLRKAPIIAGLFFAAHAVVHVALPVVDLFFHVGMILPLILGIKNNAI